MSEPVIFMNAKILLKTIFAMLMLLLLVLMGMNNQQQVSFSLPPLFKGVSQPAAIMYFAFFGVGVLTGTILSAGGKKGAAPKSGKSDK